jgi:hypothetical protein
MSKRSRRDDYDYDVTDDDDDDDAFEELGDRVSELPEPERCEEWVRVAPVQALAYRQHDGNNRWINDYALTRETMSRWPTLSRQAQARFRSANPVLMEHGWPTPMPRYQYGTKRVVDLNWGQVIRTGPASPSSQQRTRSRRY